MALEGDPQHPDALPRRGDPRSAAADATLYPLAGPRAECLVCRQPRRSLAADAPCPECGAAPPAAMSIAVIGSTHFTAPQWSGTSVLAMAVLATILFVPSIINWASAPTNASILVVLRSPWFFVSAVVLAAAAVLVQLSRRRVVRVRKTWVFDVAGIRKFGWLGCSHIPYHRYKAIEQAGRDLRFVPASTRDPEWFLRIDAPESSTAAIAERLAWFHAKATAIPSVARDPLDPMPRRVCRTCGGRLPMTAHSCCPACTAVADSEAVIGGRRKPSSGTRLTLKNWAILIGCGVALVALAAVPVMVCIAFFQAWFGTIPWAKAFKGLKALIFAIVVVPVVAVRFLKQLSYLQGAPAFRNRYWEVHDSFVVLLDDRDRFVVPLSEITEVRQGAAKGNWREVVLDPACGQFDLARMWIAFDDQDANSGLLTLIERLALQRAQSPPSEKPSKEFERRGFFNLLARRRGRSAASRR
jgi:hypothetical protein